MRIMYVSYTFINIIHSKILNIKLVSYFLRSRQSQFFFSLVDKSTQYSLLFLFFWEILWVVSLIFNVNMWYITWTIVLHIIFFFHFPCRNLSVWPRNQGESVDTILMPQRHVKTVSEAPWDLLPEWKQRNTRLFQSGGLWRIAL